jgi:hypothetical protein
MAVKPGKAWRDAEEKRTLQLVIVAGEPLRFVDEPPGAASRSGARRPRPRGSRGIGANAKASSPAFGKAWGLTRAQSFKHKAHQATSRGTFEVFQKSGFLMFLGADAQPRRPGAR